MPCEMGGLASGHGRPSSARGGRRIIRHRFGLASRAMLLVSQITNLDFVVPLDDMPIADASSVEARGFSVPRLEAEFALVLAKPISYTRINAQPIAAALCDRQSDRGVLTCRSPKCRLFRTASASCRYPSPS